MNAPNFRTLDLNLLRVFDEVMAERSLTRAARNLSLTQPAVSNALRRLRETLGDELVQRSGQGMAPTPRALAIWPAVREALRQLQESLIPNEFVPGQAQSTFVLAMADATAAELVPGLTDTLEREAPGVTMRVVPLSTRDPRLLLDEEACDLAVGHFPSVLADLTAREQSGEPVPFLHRRLYDAEYVCVMRQGHALASGPFTLERFCSARHMLVSFSGRPFGFIDESLALLGRKRQVVLTVNQFFTAGRGGGQLQPAERDAAPFHTRHRHCRTAGAAPLAVRRGACACRCAVASPLGAAQCPPLAAPSRRARGAAGVFSLNRAATGGPARFCILE